MSGTMAQLPRGISPELLVSQVQNTMPYLFAVGPDADSLREFEPARIVTDFASSLDQTSSSGRPLSHFEYFGLCLSSHYLSCGAPVPTDVDNQIRRRLWHPQLPLEIALQMADLVIESRRWDFTRVTNRFVTGAQGSPWEKEVLSGHLGEWFTLAAGAYGGLGQYTASEAAAKRLELLNEVDEEVRRHSEIFGSIWRADEGLSCLRASALIAHNFGDLDRVMDMWELPPDDPLRLRYYGLTSRPFDAEGKLRYQGRLWTAGQLYKAPIGGSAMAAENHRHFALRRPKCLRENQDFLVPIGPFFDEWGRTVARGLAEKDGAPSERTLEVIEALRQGWDRLAKTVGYGRALRGILEVHPGLSLEGLSKSARTLMSIPQERFEAHWAEEALRELDDIPSRA